MTPADGEQAPAGDKVEVKEPATAADALKDKGPWFGTLAETDDDEKAFKTWVEKKDFKDPVSALKGYRELEKHVGANRVVLPDDKADISQWEGWDKLNIPKEAKDYKINRPQLPEGMTWDEGFEKQALERAAKLRAPPHVVQGLVEEFANAQIVRHNALKEHEATEAKGLQDLFKEWGADKEANVDFAKRGAKFLGWTDEEIATVESVQGGKSMMTALAKLGKRVREGSTMEGDSQNVFGAEAAYAELTKLNERIEKGEKLSKEELERRGRLYAEALPVIQKKRA